MNIKQYMIGAAATLLMSGCGDFLEEYSQENDYVRSWEDLNELLIGDCYMVVNLSADFQSYSNYGMFLHLFSDEIEEYTQGESWSSSFDQHQYMFGYLTWQPRVGVTEDFTSYRTENGTWTQIYKYINVANNILKSVENVPQGTGTEIAGANYVKGQAHFLRAFYYFWLTNLYGQPYDPETATADLGVPVKTEPEVIDIKYSRNTVAECYELIESDLLLAEQELGAAGSITRKSIYRADSVSVKLLLSRVYLYMQNWEKAAEYAQKVIDIHPSLQNLNTDSSPFATTDNPETIFSMGGDDLPRFLCNAVQCLRISREQYNSYSVNDIRRTQWLWTYGTFHGLTKRTPSDSYTEVATSNYYYYYRFSDESDYAEVSSLFWLRSGEAYLNLAEAEAYMGDETAAKEAVNTLRRARMYNDSPDMEITSSGSALISDIRNERRRELIGEGHRWYDMRRYRVCGVQPEKETITHTYTYYQDRGSANIIETRQFVLTEDDASWTAPIPQEVIDFNTGMQNNGNVYRDYTVVETPI